MTDKEEWSKWGARASVCEVKDDLDMPKTVCIIHVSRRNSKGFQMMGVAEIAAPLLVGGEAALHEIANDIECLPAQELDTDLCTKIREVLAKHLTD